MPRMVQKVVVWCTLIYRIDVSHCAISSLSFSVVSRSCHRGRRLKPDL